MIQISNNFKTAKAFSKNKFTIKFGNKQWYCFKSFKDFEIYNNDNKNNEFNEILDHDNFNNFNHKYYKLAFDIDIKSTDDNYDNTENDVAKLVCKIKNIKHVENIDDDVQIIVLKTDEQEHTNYKKKSYHIITFYTFKSRYNLMNYVEENFSEFPFIDMQIYNNKSLRILNSIKNGSNYPLYFDPLYHEGNLPSLSDTLITYPSENCKLIDFQQNINENVNNYHNENNISSFVKVDDKSDIFLKLFDAEKIVSIDKNNNCDELRIRMIKKYCPVMDKNHSKIHENIKDTYYINIPRMTYTVHCFKSNSNKTFKLNLNLDQWLEIMKNYFDYKYSNITLENLCNMYENYWKIPINFIKLLKPDIVAQKDEKNEFNIMNRKGDRILRKPKFNKLQKNLFKSMGIDIKDYDSKSNLSKIKFEGKDYRAFINANKVVIFYKNGKTSKVFKSVRQVGKIEDIQWIKCNEKELKLSEFIETKRNHHINQQNITAIWAKLGSGKTIATYQHVREFHKTDSLCIIAPFITLSTSMSDLYKKNGIENFHYAEKSIDRIDQIRKAKRLSITPNSLKHLSPYEGQIIARKVLVIEELPLVLKALMDSGDDKEINMNTFIYLFKHAKHIYTSSADLNTPICIDFLKQFKNTKFILNEFNHDLNRNANYIRLIGSNTKKNIDFIISEVDNKLSIGPLGIVCTTKSMVKKIKNILKLKYPNKKISSYSGDDTDNTVNFEKMMNELKDGAKYWSDLDIVIFNNIIPAGVSYIEEHFKSVILVDNMYVDTCMPSDIINTLNRIRKFENLTIIDVSRVYKPKYNNRWEIKNDMKAKINFICKQIGEYGIYVNGILDTPENMLIVNTQFQKDNELFDHELIYKNYCNDYKILWNSKYVDMSDYENINDIDDTKNSDIISSDINTLFEEIRTLSREEFTPIHHAVQNINKNVDEEVANGIINECNKKNDKENNIVNDLKEKVKNLPFIKDMNKSIDEFKKFLNDDSNFKDVSDKIRTLLNEIRDLLNKNDNYVFNLIKSKKNLLEKYIDYKEFKKINENYNYINNLTDLLNISDNDKFLKDFNKFCNRKLSIKNDLKIKSGFNDILKSFKSCNQFFKTIINAGKQKSFRKRSEVWAFSYNEIVDSCEFDWRYCLSIERYLWNENHKFLFNGRLMHDIRDIVDDKCVYKKGFLIKKLFEKYGVKDINDKINMIKSIGLSHNDEASIIIKIKNNGKTSITDDKNLCIHVFREVLGKHNILNIKPIKQKKTDDDIKIKFEMSFNFSLLDTIKKVFSNENLGERVELEEMFSAEQEHEEMLRAEEAELEEMFQAEDEIEETLRVEVKELKEAELEKVKVKELKEEEGVHSI